MKIILMFWITLVFVLSACGQSSPRLRPEPSPTWGFDYTYCTCGIMLANENIPSNEGCPETAPRVIRDRSDIEEPIATDPVTGWTIFRCDHRTGGGHISGCQVQGLCGISADGQEMRRLTGACAMTPIAISPDGRWLVTVTESPRNRPCHVNLVKMRLDGSESQVLAGDEWGFCNLFSLEWSSDLDGDWVLFQAAHGISREQWTSPPAYRARIDGGGVEQINMRFVRPTPVLPAPTPSNACPP